MTEAEEDEGLDESGLIEQEVENDMPLVVKYNVASLGEIKLCLAKLPST